MILVTGGCGYIGSHIVSKLVADGIKTVVIDNLSTGFRNSIPSEVPLEVCDLSQLDSIREVFKKYPIRAVIHMAAATVVPESISNPIKYYDNNTCNTAHLLLVMREFEVTQLVFSSTAAVYGEVDGIVTESHPVCPISPYGRSKEFSEKIIHDCSVAFDLNFAILRYFNVAGASIDGMNGQKTKDATHLIKVACEVACGKRDEFHLFGDDYDTPDGTCIRDFIHVEDLAEIHVLVLEQLKNKNYGQTLNCGYGFGISVAEVLDTVSEISGKHLAIRKKDRRPGDIAQIMANPAKLMAETGWRPKYADIRTIVKTAYEFERGLHR